jgi:hypothetical protein
MLRATSFFPGEPPSSQVLGVIYSDFLLQVSPFVPCWGVGRGDGVAVINISAEVSFFSFLGGSDTLVHITFLVARKLILEFPSLNSSLNSSSQSSLE